MLNTHPTDNIIVIGKMRLAMLATKDLVGGDVGVVREPHHDWFSYLPLATLL